MTAASELMLEMLLNGVTGIRQIIENGLARQSLLLQKGVLQKGVLLCLIPGTLSGKSAWFLSLRRRFPPLTPHRLMATVSIFPGCRLSFLLDDWSP